MVVIFRGDRVRSAAHALEQVFLIGGPEIAQGTKRRDAVADKPSDPNDTLGIVGKPRTPIRGREDDADEKHNRSEQSGHEMAGQPINYQPALGPWGGPGGRYRGRLKYRSVNDLRCVPLIILVERIDQEVLVEKS